MGTEEFGIDKIEQARDAVADVVLNLIEAIKDDDGLTLAEGLTIAVQAVPEFAEVWNSRVELLAQIKDVSLDELIVLVNGLIEKLELENEELEVVLKKGLTLVIAGADFGIALRDLRKESE